MINNSIVKAIIIYPTNITLWVYTLIPTLIIVIIKLFITKLVKILNFNNISILNVGI